MLKNEKIIRLFPKLILISFLLYSCVGSSSVGVFGSGVSVAFDPRTVGMQIDDSIMQKNLIARLALTEKKYLIYVNTKVIDGNIFLSWLTNLWQSLSRKPFLLSFLYKNSK